MLLIGFIGLACACTGYGLAARRTWDPTGPPPSIGDAGLGGLLILTASGMLLHFFLPLTPALALALASIGLVLFALHALPALGRRDRLSCLFMALCAATFCWQAQSDSLHPDAGIYYVPAILWNGESPLIPGLANVQGRLGYNGATLVLASVLRLPVLPWQAAFSVNALLAFFVMIALFERLRRADLARLSTIYGLLLAGGFCAANFVFNGNLGSLAGDFAPFILACYIGLLLLANSGAWACLLAGFAVVLKVSALPLLVGSAGYLLLVRRREKATVAALGVTAGLLAIWALRGLALSGCAAYPAAATCAAALPWTVPPELARNESQYILDYARGSVQDPRSAADWLAPMTRELRGNHIGRFLLLLSGLALLLHLAGFRRSLGPDARASVAPLLIGAGWLLFAVWKGPALRFYGGGAFLLVYTALALGLFRFRDKLAALPGQAWLPVVLCLLMARQGGSLAIKHLRAPAAKSWPAFETPQLLPERTESGLDVAVSKTEYCWDAPLPCTPYFDGRLRRVPWLDRYYFTGRNTVAYRNGFPQRSKVKVD